MGDAGSFFLGFTLAALGVMGEWTENRLISCAIPVLILGVPLFDFTYILIARILRGETRTLRSIIDHCAPDHLSHRLLWIGFRQRTAVFFIYLISITLGVSGILLRNSESYLIPSSRSYRACHPRDCDCAHGRRRKDAPAGGRVPPSPPASGGGALVPLEFQWMSAPRAGGQVGSSLSLGV